MITMGKAITSGHAPLGAVAVNGRIAGHFDANPLVTGLTHNAHPISLAAALATLEVLRDEKLVPSVRRGLDSHPGLRARRALHRVIRSSATFSSLGLYGVIGSWWKDRATREPLEAPVKELARRTDRGVRLATRWNYICSPRPLCIDDEADLAHGLDVSRATC